MNVLNFTSMKTPLANLFKIPVSTVLEGFTDWHSHMLPGVDDGCRAMDESISLLKMYEEAGVRSVYVTPHIMQDIPNQTADLKVLFERIRRKSSGMVHLSLASENMLDFLFGQRMLERDFLMLSGSRILVEAPLYNKPEDFDKYLEDIRNAGMVPVLAHPERYVFLNEKQYRELYKSGVRFQVNLPSLAGIYGAEVKERAEMIAGGGMADYYGTDVHGTEEFRELRGSYIGRRWAEKIISL